MSPLANREQFSLIEGFLFVGCHAINLEPKTEFHLAAGDLLRVVNRHAATGYKSVSSHRLFCIQLFPPGHSISLFSLAQYLSLPCHDLTLTLKSIMLPRSAAASLRTPPPCTIAMIFDVVRSLKLINPRGITLEACFLLRRRRSYFLSTTCMRCTLPFRMQPLAWQSSTAGCASLSLACGSLLRATPSVQPVNLRGYYIV